MPHALKMGAMLPKYYCLIRALPLLAGLAFLAHIHYSKVVRSARLDHHAFTATSARGR